MAQRVKKTKTNRAKAKGRISWTVNTAEILTAPGLLSQGRIVKEVYVLIPGTQEASTGRAIHPATPAEDGLQYNDPGAACFPPEVSSNLCIVSKTFSDSST